MPGHILWCNHTCAQCKIDYVDFSKRLTIIYDRIVCIRLLSSYSTITGNGDVYGSGSESFIVVFPAGVTNVSFDIPISDDNILEDNENFVLTIDPSSLPTNVTIGDPGQATVTIVDDDCKL